MISKERDVRPPAQPTISEASIERLSDKLSQIIDQKLEKLNDAKVLQSDTTVPADHASSTASSVAGAGATDVTFAVSENTPAEVTDSAPGGATPGGEIQNAGAAAAATVIATAPAAAGATPKKLIGSAQLESDEVEKYKGMVKDNVLTMLMESTSKQDANKSLNMLFLVFENLRKHPSQEKYRKVNTSSSRFKERFGQKLGASSLLLLIGFEKKGQNFVYAVADGEIENNTLPIKPGKCPVAIATESISDCLHSFDGMWEEAEGKKKERDVSSLGSLSLPGC